MDDKNKLVDDVQAEVKRGSGSLLATARKQQDKTVEEIADQLNLSVTQIRTIESDQSEGLPEPTYVRGYIRSYARLLNLNPDEVLEHYLNPNWQKGARLDDMPRDIGSADEDRRGGFFTPAKLLIALILAACIAYLFFSGKFNELATSRSPSTVSTPAVVNTPVVASPGAESVDQAVVSPQLQSSESDSLLNEPGDNNELIVEAAQVVVEPVGNTLSLNFSDTSWVDIRDSNGERLAYKSYAQGEVLSVSSTTKMSVFIGNAKAVSADLNGEAYDISQFREGVFARFSIGSND